MLTLDRLRITGILNSNTPYLVIYEIAVSLGVQIDINKIKDQEYMIKVLSCFARIPRITLKDLDNLTNDELAKIARYVNPKANFSRQDLLTAFNFLQSFIGEKSLTIPYTIGQQTPQNIYSLNYCVCYKLLTQAGYRCKFDMSEADFEEAMLLLTLTPQQMLQLSYLHVATFNTKMLLSLLSINSDFGTYHKPTYSSLDNSYTKMTTICPPPSNSNECIIRAALDFQVNIVNAVNPYREYIRLLKYNTSWKPKDEELLKIYNRDKLSLDLNETFEKLLPKCTYKESQLIHIAENEGLPRSSDYYADLIIAMQHKNFYHGWQPSSNSTSIFLGDTFSELNNEEILCFGVKGEIMHATTYSELTEAYKNMDTLSNPFVNKSDPAEFRVPIRKLRKLCKTRREGETDEIMNQRKDLLLQLELIELKVTKSLEAARLYGLKYQKLSKELQKRVIFMLTTLMNVFMYVRGWNGKERYPMESRTTDVDKIEEIFNEKIKEFYILNNELGEIGQDTLSLPLLRYRKSAFITVLDPKVGRTINEKLKIIMYDKTNVNSCLRMSSNYMIHTTYRYLSLLGYTPDFNLNEMSEIH